MRWVVLWLGAVFVMACAGPSASPASAPAASAPATFAPFTPNPNEPWRLTATAAVVGAGRATPTTAAPQATLADPVDPRRLAADPAAYRGKNLVLEGRAMTVRQDADFTWIHLNADVLGVQANEDVVVRVRPKNADVLRGNCYEVRGLGAGTETATRALTGAPAVMPLIEAYAIRPGRSDSRQTYCVEPAS